jgi:hypothetical protein
MRGFSLSPPIVSAGKGTGAQPRQFGET